MAWYFPKSSDVNDLALAIDHDVFVAEPVFLNAGMSLNQDGHEVIVAGTVATAGYKTIVVGSTLADDGWNMLKVESTGQVRGFDTTTVSLYGADQQATNRGLITQDGPQDVGYAAVYFRCLVSGATTQSTFNNAGTVEAIGYGVYRHDSTESFALTNSGTIAGGLNSFYSNSAAKDSVINTGTMIGDIRLSGGGDLYDGRTGTIIGTVFGEDGNDRIYTGAGNDRLNGGKGSDTLQGGAGNDTYYVDNALDKIAEATGQGTADWVATSVTYGLGAGVQVEKLSTTSSGATTAINLSGNEFAQSITGNAGANFITGKGGNDTLTGGAGADTFFFDTAIGPANVDRITDFNVAADTIRLENGVFTQIAETGC